MISQFSLKFGRVPGLAPEQISTTPVTVFVSPNNSGKSTVLSEIERFCRSGQENVLSVVLKDLTFEGLTLEETTKAIEHITQPPNAGETITPDYVIVGGRGGRQQVPLDALTQAVQNPTGNLPAFCQWFLNHGTLMLDGRSRINLVTQQPAGDLQQAPQSSFQVLFRDDVKRREVRRIVADAFGSYYVIDPTNLVHD